ncbi:hypothetical protein JCM10212_007093 [Sporobolomyces blumeae]
MTPELALKYLISHFRPRLQRALRDWARHGQYPFESARFVANPTMSILAHVAHRHHLRRGDEYDADLWLLEANADLTLGFTVYNMHIDPTIAKIIEGDIANDSDARPPRVGAPDFVRTGPSTHKPLGGYPAAHMRFHLDSIHLSPDASEKTLETLRSDLVVWSMPAAIALSIDALHRIDSDYLQKYSRALTIAAGLRCWWNRQCHEDDRRTSWNDALAHLRESGVLLHRNWESIASDCLNTGAAKDYDFKAHHDGGWEQGVLETTFEEMREFLTHKPDEIAHSNAPAMSIAAHVQLRMYRHPPAAHDDTAERCFKKVQMKPELGLTIYNQALEIPVRSRLERAAAGDMRQHDGSIWTGDSMLVDKTLRALTVAAGVSLWMSAEPDRGARKQKWLETMAILARQDVADALQWQSPPPLVASPEDAYAYDEFADRSLLRGVGRIGAAFGELRILVEQPSRTKPYSTSHTTPAVLRSLSQSPYAP